MRKFLVAIPLVIAFALGYLFWDSLPRNPQELPSVLLGKAFPSFSLPALNPDQGVLTESNVKGPVLVNVWATWCPSCHVEHPYLVELAKLGIPIIGLNYKDETAKAREWLVEKGDPYIFNIVDESGRLGLDLGVTGAPETYLVDAQGVIQYRHVGVVDTQVWQQKLAPLYQQLESNP